VAATESAASASESHSAEVKRAKAANQALEYLAATLAGIQLGIHVHIYIFIHM